jgi:hypothetical protein
MSPTTVLQGLANPRGLVVDTTQLYVTTFDDGIVLSCPFTDCSTPKVLAREQDAPLRIAIEGGRLYWTNSAGDTIGSVDVAGEGPPVIFASGVTSPKEIAVDDHHVFVSTGEDIYVVSK